MLGQQISRGGAGHTRLGPPQEQHFMDGNNKKKTGGLPTSPMVYAIITDMNVFGNPKVVDEQHHQYPSDAPPLPALVPLTLEKMKLNIECHISTGFVTSKSVWDVSCVRSQAFCNCLLAAPMDNQGTVSGVEIELGNDRLYTTIVVPQDEAASYGARGSPGAEVGDPGMYNPEFFRLNIPQVEGGSKLTLKITWFQPMTFAEGLYSLRVPFVFPETILPFATELASITKIKCTINTGTNDPVEVGKFDNPMKETNREPGMVTLKKHNSEEWTNQDFVASYRVSSR
jgi:hypothetical protein